MFQNLTNKGFDVVIRNHAGAIFSVDFPAQAQELEDVLLQMTIPAADLVGSGGGEAKSTQWLRNELYKKGWPKHNFEFKSFLDGNEQLSMSHEIDHVRRADAGTIACEIEWNNKDPFFDRDLENFQRLHAQTAISMGVIITRGKSLQDNMRTIIQDCLTKHNVVDEGDLMHHFDMKDRTARQRDAVKRMTDRQIPFADAFAKQFTSDKFGTATTHWSKLKERIDRGVGNPCPMLLIGMPASIVIP
ncbi:restriction endonuclease BglII [Roseovarius sp. A-2]|uniref:BglII/BstYI family type II restriction endonuclease n=1 Tax=Roseovarius sp. A-2 TaxID=1570360 RepID=UPI0009B594DB|nr:BglII/BstYI family type II restriction endonuclease [Roseovarius sp. A-2]GAW34642.1 restriction endonuclease BglII [Roseovarius sp. A-2]